MPISCFILIYGWLIKMNLPVKIGGGIGTAELTGCTYHTRCHGTGSAAAFLNEDRQQCCRAKQYGVDQIGE